MFKKILSVFTLLAVFTLLVSCGGSKTIKVHFETNGGSTVTDVTLYKEQAIPEFDDPTKAGNTFLGWYEDPAFGKMFNFATVISESVTLYAKWTDEVAIRYNTKTTASVPSQLLGTGGKVYKPADPVREGYRFGGWFFGKAGLNTYEPEAVEFPIDIDKSTTLFAYWEPLDSKNVKYTKGESYTSSLLSTSSMILNPLVYQWSHEDTFIGMLVAPMYSTEVDWDSAIEAGVADYYGDFSKVEAHEYSIEAFDYKYLKIGALHYPIDSKGDEHLKDGNYDRAGASKFFDTIWTITLRDDIKFEDGTPIDAYTFEYTLQQYLDPDQVNYRSTIFYKDPDNKNGYPLKGAVEYLKEGGSWENVGFTVNSKYEFTIEFTEVQSQATAVGFANSVRLVHPEKYARSLDRNNRSKYGTPAHPFVSYGPYVIKSWDEGQKLVFNKNFDYVAKGTITYKCQVYEIVDELAKAYELFKDGTTNVLGLTNDYYAEFSEDPNMYKSWEGYPQYLILNTAKSKLKDNGNVHPTIMTDIRFRQALFYGFDRNYFADSVYAPNTATTLTIPLDTKAYIQDPLYYSQSPNHLAVLEKHGIAEETNGFIPERAKELFDDGKD